MTQSPVAKACFDLPDGGRIVLIDPETALSPGVIQRLDIQGRTLWETAARDAGDLFVDIEMAGDEVVAVSWRGVHYRINAVNGAIRSTEFVK